MTDSGFRRLIVMRHAKTEAFAGSDHTRRLTERGVRDAVAAGRWLAENDVIPDFALVSSAARARGTYDCMCVGLGQAPDVRIMDELYDASVDDALEECSVIPEEAQCAILIGHNPTMAELSHALQSDPSDAWAPHLPTAGLAVLDCECPWDEMSRSVALLTYWHVARG